MTIIIIEDEKPSARLLQRKVEKLGFPVTTLLHSVEEAIHWFQNNQHPDLIFLDIQLSDGLSFEIFDAVDIKSAIIFTTAYQEYAIKAFKLSAVDYLLKPINPTELLEAVNRFQKLTSQKIKVLHENLGKDFSETKKIGISHSNGIELILPDEIVYIKGEGAYSEIRA